MFTGIVEEVGTVRAVTALDDAARLDVAGSVALEGLQPGDSLAVNGVCLTVTEMGADSVRADVMLETLRRTSLGGLQTGSPVNLERALRLDARLGGHLVQGHVDGTGQVLEIDPASHWTVIRISIPSELARYLVEKGSVAVDGVSLTVASTDEASFTVSLIPTTLAGTNLGAARVGDTVNLEVDVLAKYVERLMAGRAT